MARLKIPAVFIRGGTSKGVFFHERDLPKDPALRDQKLTFAHEYELNSNPLENWGLF